MRGLRMISDFEYEFRMAHANHKLAPEIETIALITAQEHSFLSSSTVREIASLGGDVSTMVPLHVQRALRQRFEPMMRVRSRQEMQNFGWPVILTP